MHLHFRRAMLAAVLGLGVVAGLVRADGPGQPRYYQNAQIYQPQGLLTHPYEPVKRPSRFHKPEPHPWCCWTHHNELGCNSAKASCAFIFGNCRTFFGEPCRKGPPQIPW